MPAVHKNLQTASPISPGRCVRSPRHGCDRGRRPHAVGDRGIRPVRPGVERELTLRRWQRIQEHAEHPLRITDLSSAAGVSERTLREGSSSIFGMGPLSYIRTWQLHRIRAALLRAEPGQATVTSVAMRLGVWDLEAMAGRYRWLFGERPVETVLSSTHRLTARAGRAAGGEGEAGCDATPLRLA